MGIDSDILTRQETKTDELHYGIYNYGAHCYAYQPPNQKPILWLSKFAQFAPGKAIRGGIPIILPWFGKGISGDKRPSHGVARLTSWNLSGIENTVDMDGKLIVLYDLTSEQAGDTENSWIANYRVEFSPHQLEVSLTVINTGKELLQLETALHTYLAVSDISQVSIDGLDQCAYIDSVPGANPKHRLQEGAVTFDSETDRIYLSRGKVVVVDPEWNRKLIVHKTGSANTVIWNPGPQRCAEMVDMGSEDWRQMVCVEAANVLDNAILLSPRGSQVLTQKISFSEI